MVPLCQSSPPFHIALSLVLCAVAGDEVLVRGRPAAVVIVVQNAERHLVAHPPLLLFLLLPASCTCLPAVPPSSPAPRQRTTRLVATSWPPLFGLAVFFLSRPLTFFPCSAFHFSSLPATVLSPASRSTCLWTAPSGLERGCCQQHSLWASCPWPPPPPTVPPTRPLWPPAGTRPSGSAGTRRGGRPPRRRWQQKRRRLPNSLLMLLPPLPRLPPPRLLPPPRVAPPPPSPVAGRQSQERHRHPLRLSWRPARRSPPSVSVAMAVEGGRVVGATGAAAAVVAVRVRRRREAQAGRRRRQRRPRQRLG